MHRSGTSLITELVSKCFPSTGEQSLVPPDRWNQRGYWEYQPLVQLNTDLLHAANSRGYVPPGDERVARLETLGRSGIFHDRALCMLRSLQSFGTSWYLKDPRTCVLLPFWSQFLRNVSYIVTIRHPEESARSLFRKDGVPISAGITIWQRHLLEAMNPRYQLAPRLLVEYDSVLKNPDRECQRIYHFLHRYHTDVVDVHDAIQEMKTSIQRQLRHHEHVNATLSLSNEQRLLYARLREAAITTYSDIDLNGCGQPNDWRDILLETWHEAARKPPASGKLK
jgi:hypothetical protein